MVLFSSHSGIYSLRTEQFLPISREEAWSFFSSPGNLQEITPAGLNFQITSPNLEDMYEGQIITYKIGIFPLISNNWVTEITSVKPMVSFIDEQRFGPYKMWHHLHTFEPVEGGVMMRDIVHFKLPFGFLGRLFYPILIKPKLSQIFHFRKEKLEDLFKQSSNPELRLVKCS